MGFFNKLQNLVGKGSSDDDEFYEEASESTQTNTQISKSRYFSLQVLHSLERMERDGATYVCASPAFECYFKKTSMPLFADKREYLKVAHDQAGNVTHVCGFLPRLQSEKDQGKEKEANITLSKIPKCLLADAIKEVTDGPAQGASATANEAYQASAGGKKATGSGLFFNDSFSVDTLTESEKEWLGSMRASLVDSEFKILLQLLQYSIVTRGFQEKIETFLANKVELVPGSRGEVIESFKYLAREFQINDRVISAAQIGSRLEQVRTLLPQEIFIVIVELFFCLGYDNEIEGYTTGFTDPA